ncbi:MAG: GBS Bsp-like repeat-containing protein [Coriobacteriia bacterium]|nr:GBS Bsp-like repeat-containing protein [Coriobacteriia bacterium]
MAYSRKLLSSVLTCVLLLNVFAPTLAFAENGSVQAESDVNTAHEDITTGTGIGLDDGTGGTGSSEQKNITFDFASTVYEETVDAIVDVVEYVYIDALELVLGTPQNVVVGFIDEELEPISATLYFEHLESGAQLSAKADNAIPGAVLFELDPADLSTLGSYQLTSVEYMLALDGHVYVVDFSTDPENAYFFTVVEEGTKGDEGGDTVEITAFAVDEGGALVEQEELTVALEEAESAITGVAISASSAIAPTSSAAQIVVVLDPGHGGTEPGAVYGGMREADINLAIAQACADELRQYDGVRVVMTRTTNVNMSIVDRAIFAANQGAHVLISIHCNASTNTAVNGAEIWIPNNASFHLDHHYAASQLSIRILAELQQLGLANRGFFTRNGDTNYPSPGGLTDWYGLIREARLRNVPAIIVENAFMSNPTEMARLSNPSFLRQLGAANATGIALHFGLTKWTWNAQVSSTLASNQRTATITIAPAGAPAGLTSIRVPVWGAANGQNDIRWYNAVRQPNGSWTVTVPLSNHRETGRYHAHAYARTDGAEKLIGSTTFTVTAPTGRIATSHYNAAAGTFRVTVSNINAPAGISQVRVPVWHNNNGRQEHLVWYTATRQSNGDYTVNVAASNHGWRTGTYEAHAYVRDGNGAETLVAGTRQTVQRPPVEVRTAVSSNQRQVSFYVAGGQTVNATAVWFPTWSNRNGQDDLVWHRATRMADGSWQATVPLSLHRDTGAYTMHVHADIPGSGRVVVGSKAFTVTPPTGRVSTSHYNASTGMFRVTAGNLRVPQGISEVQIAVWRDNNGRQDQLRWFRATRQANGDYTLNVAASNHGWLTGTYVAHAYVRDANGHFTIVGSARQNVQRPPVEVRTAVSSNQRQVSFYVAGGQTVNATAVWFPTWSNRNGQDDLVWHRATRMADGSWQATVPLSLHRDAGAYTMHVHADIPGGGRVIAGSKNFTVAPPTGTPVVRSVNTNAGTMVVEMTVGSPAGVQAVQFPFWSNANQSDIQWVNATHVGNNVYRATLTTPHRFDRQERTYQIHGYVRTGNGHFVLTGSTSRTFSYTGTLNGAPIMGASQTNVAQMVRYFNSSGATYPGHIYGQYGAPTITDWCRILLEEANREGVRAEVVMTQAMKETGWLRFGGQVQVAQCNFGGIGATNGGAAGADFRQSMQGSPLQGSANGVRRGLRAQVQHLKGYATTTPAAQFATFIESPRFHFLADRRGVAPTVIGLNGRWAVPGTTYGQDITAMIQVLLSR